MKDAIPKRTRLLVLSQYYRPEPSFITADVAVEMSLEMDVTVITAHPNYPLGRFYDSVTSLRPTRSVEDGVTVWRLPIIPYHGNAIAWRIAHYFSYTLFAMVFAPVVAGRVDIVWVYQTPFTVALAAIWFRAVHGARVIYTCADLWPESLVASNVARSGLLVRVLYWFSRAINRLADAIIAPTRGTLARYERDGIPAARLHHVPVWVDGIRDLPSSAATSGRPCIVYAGNLGPAQGLSVVIRAAARLQREGVMFDLNLYGSGSAEPSLRALADAEGATSVHFCGRISPSEAFRVSAEATSQVISLEPSPLFAMTVPSKIASCLAAGTPILFGLLGEAAEIVRQSGAGIPFDPADPATCATAIRRLLALSTAERAQMGRAARATYEESFERDGLIARYRDIFMEHNGRRGTLNEPIGRRTS